MSANRPIAFALEPPASPSRRTLLTGALGGIGAAIAGLVMRASPTAGAVGDNLKAGSVVTAGGQTSGVTNNSDTNGTWIVTQNGKGTAIRGQAPKGIGGRFSTNNANKVGLVAANNGSAAGDGAAIQAEGGDNVAVRATSTGLAIDATGGSTAINAVADGFAIMAEITGVGSAVYGFAGNVAGGGIGLSGVSWGSNGYGVYGRATNGSGVTRGVYGDAFSAAGYGVYGYASPGTGVFGKSTNGWSGRFEGDTRVDNDFQAGGNASVGDVADGYLQVYGDFNADGTISAHVKAFKIDHPAAPGEKYLLHYSAESNEILNLYSGTTALDADGEATVKLPAWFGLINTDVRYQLTPIGAFSPLYIKAEVADGRFTIAGGNAAQRVSWQLTARRNDPFVREHGAPVEVAKVGRERGTYLQPALYGQSTDKRRVRLVPQWQSSEADTA